MLTQRCREVGDLMTHPVVQVQPGTPFSEIVRVLRQYDITAVPVVDGAGRPAGVVSEADLLVKEVDRWETSRFETSTLWPAARAKSGAMTAEGLMTQPAVCARPEWSVVHAAHTMYEHRVKRLPVVDATGRLVGVISRTDLLRVFLRGDRAIRAEIIEEVIAHTLHEPPSAVDVQVDSGRVTLSGSVEDEEAVPLLVRLCRGVDGVVEVDNRLRGGR